MTRIVSVAYMEIKLGQIHVASQEGQNNAVDLVSNEVKHGRTCDVNPECTGEKSAIDHLDLICSFRSTYF